MLQHPSASAGPISRRFRGACPGPGAGRWPLRSRNIGSSGHFAKYNETHIILDGGKFGKEAACRKGDSSPRHLCRCLRVLPRVTESTARGPISKLEFGQFRRPRPGFCLREWGLACSWAGATHSRLDLGTCSSTCWNYAEPSANRALKAIDALNLVADGHFLLRLGTFRR